MKKYLLIRISVPLIAILAIFFFLFFSGAEFRFSQGTKFTKQGKYAKAITQYQICAEKYPKHQRAAEALFRIAEIYDQKLNDCLKAKKIYRKIIKDYSISSWAKLAKEAIIHCYDYFPLNTGNFWVEGDSETGGKNYRAEVSCLSKQNETVGVISRVYAGKKLVSTTEKVYVKSIDGLREYKKLIPGSKDYNLVLRYPLIVGKSWAVRPDSDEMTCIIETKDAVVETKAGKFTNCLKIRLNKKGIFDSWRFDYYAPEIGKILTATGSVRSSAEHRISELINYRIIEE